MSSSWKVEKIIWLYTKFQLEWAAKLPWAKGVLANDDKFHIVKCKVCNTIDRKPYFFASRWDTLYYEKNGCFVIGLAIQVLICIGHLQLIIFMCYECYRISCKSCRNYNSPYIWCNSLRLNYNFVTTTSFQLLCNSPMTRTIMSCWHHFSFIHQNLTRGIIKIFRDFFEIFISIIHCDYSFKMVLDYDTWHNKKFVMWHINLICYVFCL